MDFGVIGLFIGPVVLAITYKLIEAWTSSNGQGEEGVSHGK